MVFIFIHFFFFKFAFEFDDDEGEGLMIRYGSVAEFPVRLTLVDAAPRVCRALVTGIVRTACVLRATLRSSAFVVFSFRFFQ